MPWARAHQLAQHREATVRSGIRHIIRLLGLESQPGGRLVERGRTGNGAHHFAVGMQDVQADSAFLFVHQRQADEIMPARVRANEVPRGAADDQAPLPEGRGSVSSVGYRARPRGRRPDGVPRCLPK